MAQLTLNIKDSLLASEKDAVTAMGGWTATVPDPADETGVATIPNPVSQDLFFKQQIKAWLRNQAVEYANRQALAAVVVEEDV